MFDQETWHNQIVERLNTFARNPWQDIQLSGARTVFGYLALRTLEPFLEAFQREPVNAVLALANIAQGSGADYIVRQATRLRFQGGRMLERELPSNPDLCATVEHLMVALNVVHMVRQRLNSTRDDWLRHTLMKELESLGPILFVRIRNLLEDPGWKLRLGAILNLKHSQGNFTPAELILLSEGLKDSSAEVRSAAARRLGDFAHTPPVQLVKTLVHVSLHDCDMKTRRVAARALGGLRNRIASPEVLTLLVQHLSDGDCFVRSAAAMLLIELGEMAGIPPIIERLIWLLKDSDPYVREAAALALGHMGKSALTGEVMEALTDAGADSDSAVHEAAVESLIQLRKLRGTHPTAHHPHQEASLPSPSPERAGPTEVLHSREAGHSSVSPPSRKGGTTDNLSVPPSGTVEKNGHLLRRH
jgi:HEAT repeat protein